LQPEFALIAPEPRDGAVRLTLTSNYAHLAQTASASTRVIVESIGKWRIPEQAPGHKPPAAISPGVSPDDETLAGTFEVQPALEKMEQQLTQMTASSKPR
jgi:hypothetical protein